jgi:putative pyruvate formate lyase activating enzyme
VTEKTVEKQRPTEPGYLSLYKSGELARRAERLEARLAACDICPRKCGTDRLAGERGFCHSAFLPAVSSALAHHGEEPALSGTRGSGTIFFGNCNLRCVFCQNYQISQDPETQRGNEIGITALADRMLYLQDESGCHNINLVSPTHYVPQIVRALLEAVPKGLRLPLVYNTGSYDSVETLRELDGIISVYLPDLKYASDENSSRFSQAPEYPRHARAAIKEMYRQTGDLTTGDDGIAVRGVIVRHLILPHRLAGSDESLRWLAREVSPSVTVSIMSQYYPTANARTMPRLSRSIKPEEYEEVVELAEELGLENGWIQDMASKEYYLPDFSDTESPFE